MILYDRIVLLLTGLERVCERFKGKFFLLDENYSICCSALLSSVSSVASSRASEEQSKSYPERRFQVLLLFYLLGAHEA